MCHPDSPWLHYSCPCVDVCARGSSYSPSLSFSLGFFFPFRLCSSPSFSSLAAHTPCVLSRCTEDLTASLSSQQASGLQDRCAKFKVRIPEKSSLTSGSNLRAIPLTLLAVTRSSPCTSLTDGESMTRKLLQIESVNIYDSWWKNRSECNCT